MKKKLVLIGNGMAGVRCIEEILKIDKERFDITIIGQEPHPNYNRILLSKVLQGDTSLSDITLNGWDWYKQNDIQLIAGDPAVKIDWQRRTVHTKQKRKLEFGELILATGSLPFMLPLPGADKIGVTAFRDIQDCQEMIETSKTYKKAVVIGGGLLGLEAARGLLNLGMQVDVVHIHNYIMERQLDPAASKMLQRELEKQGMNFLLEKQTDRILGKKRVEGLRFKDGTETKADLVVMAVGIRPNVELARDNGVMVHRGIVVDDFMQTNVPHVYAVGECAEHRGTVYGLVAPLYEQGKALAQKICQVEGNPYEGSILSTQLKVSGVDVFSAGEFLEQEDTRAVAILDEMQGKYKKILIRDNQVVGSVLFGDISLSGSLLGLINRRADVSELKRVPIFPAQEAENTAASVPDHEIICACNNVTKGSILNAIGKEGLSTVDQIKQCTKASSSCGGCKPMVAAILEYALQQGCERGAEEVKETVCSCTALGHEELKHAIEANRFTSAQEAMAALDWIEPEGCPECLPAIQYYMSLLYPEERNQDRLLDFPASTGCSGTGSCEWGQPNRAELEQVLHQNWGGVPTPHPIQLKVSSCPCQGAESMIRDFGAIGVPGGWDLYVGGYIGASVRVGELLCTVQNAEEVVDMAGAFLQYYRETARYAERTSDWVERMGIEAIRQVLFTPEMISELLERVEAAIPMGTGTVSYSDPVGQDRMLLTTWK